MDRKLVLYLICGCLMSHPAAAASLLRGDVPVELSRNSVVAQASLQGRAPCNVLIDTGADPLMIDLETAGVEVGP